MAPQHLDHRTVIHPDALELAELLRPTWAQISADLAATGVPRCEGDADGDDGDGAADDDGDQDGDRGGDGDDGRIKADDDWQAKARKHERDAKKLRKQLEERDRKLKEREDADKSEHEKALEQAREEARTEALSEAEQDRRQDRLELAVTRLAAKGVSITDGDKTKTVKFADSDDALLRVERAVRRGDIDADDLFDSEGKVNTDTLTEALADIAAANRHLVGDSAAKPNGDADTRKGDPAQKDLESMSPEDHARRKYGAKK